MRRLATSAHASVLQASRQACCCCNVANAGSATIAIREQRRTYALSRYRDSDRHGKAANRFSRGRSAAESRHNRNVDQSTSASNSVIPSNEPPPPPANTGERKPFWSAYETYVPQGPVIEETSLEPPPVAHGDLLTLDDAASRILSEPSLVVVRQIEMMNVFLGFEQANRYRLVNARGEDVGFLAEQEGGFGTSIGRQLLRGHRPLNCVVMDTEGNVVLRVTRPISYINSRITVSKGGDPPTAANKIGECQQIWSPFRRKYALFHRYRPEDPSTHPEANNDTKALTIQEGTEPEESYAQFANVDSRMLAWDFYLQSETGQVLASINRNFMGFGREIFTDTGQYVLRFDRKMADMEVQQRITQGVGINEELKKVANENEEAKEHAGEQSKALVQVDEDRGLTLDQRAVLLATAVTIDIDYFSRQSSGMHMPMLWMPMPMPGMGGGGAEVPVEGAPGAPGEVGDISTQQAPTPSSSYPEDAPYASPDYGESPGISDSYGGSDPYGAVGSGDDVMSDPWASNDQPSGDGEGGGGLWGFFNDISDSFGGGDN